MKKEKNSYLEQLNDELNDEVDEYYKQKHKQFLIELKINYENSPNKNYINFLENLLFKKTEELNEIIEDNRETYELNNRGYNV